MINCIYNGLPHNGKYGLFPGRLCGKTNHLEFQKYWFLWSLRSLRSHGLPLIHSCLQSTQVLPVYGRWRQWQWAYPYLEAAPVGEVLSQRQGHEKGVGNTKEMELICGYSHILQEIDSQFI